MFNFNQTTRNHIPKKQYFSIKRRVQEQNNGYMREQNVLEQKQRDYGALEEINGSRSCLVREACSKGSFVFW
jgi:hypothetical protein